MKSLIEVLYQYYDHGWNMRIDGQVYVTGASKDWRDGWKDADTAIKAGIEIHKQ